jgi:hypothetical protein
MANSERIRISTRILWDRSCESSNIALDKTFPSLITVISIIVIIYED